MPISLYDATVASFDQTLGAVEGFLSRAADHFRDNALEPNDLVQERLWADMLPFWFQVNSVVHHSVGALEAVRAGVFQPDAGPSDLDYSGLQKHVAAAREKLKGFGREEVESWVGKDTTVKLGEHVLPFTAENFLLSFSVPNFYFHATTAYDILRHKGAPLGKRDFMGRIRLAKRA